VFCVKDHGIGLESSWLVRVFEIFTQHKSMANGRADGLGVGLHHLMKPVDTDEMRR
jgi:signal transduction histidine kinase